MPHKNKPSYNKAPQIEIPNSFVEYNVDTSNWSSEDHALFHERMQKRDNSIKEQTKAELTYEISADVLDSTVEPSVEQVVSMLELNHVVKEAPRFFEQVQDRSRLNPITCIVGQKDYVATSGFEGRYDERRATMSEHDLLANSAIFFQELADFERKQLKEYYDTHKPDDYGEDGPPKIDEIKTLGDDLRENLTYIGEKELGEAAGGIAQYWKAILDTDPGQQILIPIGAYGQSQAHSDPRMATRMKSDRFVLSRILDQFSDEEKQLYRGRLIHEQSEITAADPSKLRIILIDDWSISRQQLNSAADHIRHIAPQYASCIEANLLVATEKQLRYGLGKSRSGTLRGTEMMPIPVRAYYRAHNAEIEQGAYGNGGHITGSHSAVDYNFAELIKDELKGVWFDYEKLATLPPVLHAAPPIMNIVRPYRPVGTIEEAYDPQYEIFDL